MEIDLMNLWNEFLTEIAKIFAIFMSIAFGISITLNNDILRNISGTLILLFYYLSHVKVIKKEKKN